MSTRSSLFLTSDNEHCFSDCADKEFVDGKYIGDAIYFEMSKNNIEVISDDEDDLVLRIKPGTELYSMIMRMDDYNWNMKDKK